MDGSRFDALTRALAEPASRRQLLGGLAGAIGSAVLAAVGLDPEDAAAKKKCRANGDKCRKGDQCCSGKCKDRVCVKKGQGGNPPVCRRNADCPDDGNPCTAAVCDGGTRCVQIALSSNQACGENGYCGAPNSGQSGQCVECGAAPARACPDPAGQYYCADTANDPGHCGACGRDCTDGEYCFGGECRPNPEGAPCTVEEDCGPPRLDLRCVADPNTGEAMCCFGTVSGRLAQCDGVCTDVYYDANHCGACRHRCDIEHGEICYETGCCVPGGDPCEEGQRCCRGGISHGHCNDNANCGACGHACDVGQMCDRGECVPAVELEGAPCTVEADCGPLSLDLVCLADPNTGESICCRELRGMESYNAYCDGVCTNLANDPTNCGGCRTVCDAGRGETCVFTCCIPEENACEAGQQCCQSGHTCFEGRCQLTG